MSDEGYLYYVADYVREFIRIVRGERRRMIYRELHMLLKFAVT